jgi:predicted MFS family arabinose efflux permease
MLFLGTLLGMGAIQVQMIAGNILVDDLTGRALITSIVGLGFAPSMLILALFGGVAGDRMEKRTLIQISQGFSAAMALIVAVLIMQDLIIWQYLLVASVLQGAMFAFQMPARQAIIPRIVGKENITNAIALSSGGMSMMAIVGPWLAGQVYGSFGPEWVYFLIAAMYGMAVILTGRIPKVYPEKIGAATKVVREIADGFRYAWSNRLVFWLVASGLVMAVVAMPFRLMFPVFARRLYGEFDATSGLWEFDPTMIGLLLMASGVGGVIGALGVAGLGPGNGRGVLVLSGSIVSGMTIAVIAGFPVLAVGFVVMVFVGLAEALRMSLGQSLSIDHTAPEYRGRVASIYMMTFGLMPVGALPLGFAVDRFGVQPSLLVVAGVIVVASVGFLILAVPLRRLS